jgi:hypothetical protein
VLSAGRNLKIALVGQKTKNSIAQKRVSTNYYYPHLNYMVRYFANNLFPIGQKISKKPDAYLVFPGKAYRKPPIWNGKTFGTPARTPLQ